jgi:hypothetical protein
MAFQREPFSGYPAFRNGGGSVRWKMDSQPSIPMKRPGLNRKSQGGAATGDKKPPPDPLRLEIEIKTTV